MLTIGHYDRLFLRTLDRGPEMFGRSTLTTDEIAYISAATPDQVATGTDLDERRAEEAATRLYASGTIRFDERGHVERVSAP